MPPAPLPPLPDRPLSICIVGAGAIGGALAAYLAEAPASAGIASVSVVARGAQLAAIREKGLRLTSPDHPEPRSIPVTAVEDPDTLPPQDLVITALKGHQIPAMADKLARLMAPHARIVPVVNGVPWWYPVADGQGGVQGAHEVDPGGVLWRAIGPARALGAIGLFSAEVPEPGLIQLNNTLCLDLGRLPGEDRADVVRVAALFTAAGMTIKQTQPFQNALWTKIMNNCAMNSVCALSRATVHDMLNAPELRALAVAIMHEVHATGEAEQAQLHYTPEERVKQARETLFIKPSTLQDLEAGRPMEIDPIFAAAATVARAHGLPSTHLELVTALLRSIDRARFPG